ncbi:MAG: hypothetical protein M1821_003573 [Bathelium mastoideum]|nr:MAG: hypothetical protein M1821_003573 [Bathelium mastoideum]
MEVFYFGVWCRPFSWYWAVPTPNPQCSAAIHHLITNAVFNISSDVLTLALALQMFVRSKLPLKRKLVLCGIFGLGIFVIFAAALNKYYSFHQPFGSLWTFWYIRESSTAMIVANLPFLWTLLRRVFKLGSFENTEAPNTYARPNSFTPTPSRSEAASWLQYLRARGRRLSLHVIHGKNISSSKNGAFEDDARQKPHRRYVNSVTRSETDRLDGAEPTLLQASAHLQKDTEAQRPPWDEMDLGECLSDSGMNQ